MTTNSEEGAREEAASAVTMMPAESGAESNTSTVDPDEENCTSAATDKRPDPYDLETVEKDATFIRTLASVLESDRDAYLKMWKDLGDTRAVAGRIRFQVFMTYWTTKHPIEPDAKPSPRFRPIPASQLKHLPPPTWLIRDVLPDDALVVLFGAEAAGKSFVALDWGLRIATGLPWAGRAVNRGVVVYVVSEGMSGLTMRVGAWVETTHATDSEIDNLFFVTTPLQLSDEEATASLIAILVQLPEMPKLVVIDTLARAMAGAEENSAKDMGQAIENAELIRRMTGACVILVHHSPKNQKPGASSPRGSSALQGAATTVLRVRKKDDAVTLSCEKQKDAEPFKPILLRLTRVELGDGRSSCVVTHSGDACHQSAPGDDLTANEQKVLAVLRSFGPEGATSGKWQTATGLANSSFQKARGALCDKGYVVQRNGTYSVAESVLHSSPTMLAA